MARLLGSVCKKMLTVGLPAVLDDLDDTGALRATSTLPANPELTRPGGRTHHIRHAPVVRKRPPGVTSLPAAGHYESRSRSSVPTWRSVCRDCHFPCK